MSRAAAALSWFFLATASAASAQSPDAGVPDTTPQPPPEVAPDPRSEARPTAIILPNGRLLEVGCTIRVARRLESTVYVVCEDGRLIWVDTQEPYVEEVGMRGTAVGLFEHNGRLWVELVRHEALALDPHAPGAIVPSADPDPDPDPDPDASRGAGSDVTPDVEPEPNPYAFDRPRQPYGERQWLTAAARERVRQRERERRERERPTRILGWEIAGHLRPFLSEGGAGAWLELSASYAFEAPLFLRAEVDPIGGAAGRDSTGVFGAAVLAGVDHQVFQLGLGVGTQYVSVFEVERFAEGLAVALLQVARIGMRDDTHFDAESAFVWVDGDVLFAGLEARMQVTLKDTMWLVIQAGGNIGGQYFGDVGLRIWLTPDTEGSRGVYIIPAIGGASLARDGSDAITGPAVSVGFEVRP